MTAKVNEPNFTAKRIQALRFAMCLDLSNFAVAIGVDRVTVWRWEELGARPSKLASEALLREEQKLKEQSESASA